MKLIGCIFLCMILFCPDLTHAAGKKGLLVYDSIYGSTVESAYWIKAIIGHENYLDVKALPQVITVKPYDYVIIGSVTRDKKPSKKIYTFVEKYKYELAKKKVCYFLNCGESDESMVFQVPGKDIRLIGGRNYLIDIQEKFPEIKPVAIAGFGGRQVQPNLGRIDSLLIWIGGKRSKEGTPWEGHDIWESLIPGRMEAFANEVRVKILGLKPRKNVQQFRSYWESLQPASLTNSKLKKFNPKPYTEHHSTERIYFARSRIRGNLNDGIVLLKTWAKKADIDLIEQVKTFYNVYYHAVKNYEGEETTIHVVAATFTEDPGNVHVFFRCFEKPEERKGVEKDVEEAENILWADGRKVE